MFYTHCQTLRSAATDTLKGARWPIRRGRRLNEQMGNEGGDVGIFRLVNSQVTPSQPVCVATGCSTGLGGRCTIISAPCEGPNSTVAPMFPVGREFTYNLTSLRMVALFQGLNDII